MPVIQSCNPGADAVHLKLSSGQRLRYSVDADPGVDIVLRDHNGAALLLSGAVREVLVEAGRTLRSATAVREWPAHDGEAPSPGNVMHTLGIQFGGAGMLIWTVDLLDRGGMVLRMIKECRYANRGGPDEFVDRLRIFVTR
jgi:hypothetical protein